MLYNVPFGPLGHLHFCLYFNAGHAWFLRYEATLLMQYFDAIFQSASTDFENWILSCLVAYARKWLGSFLLGTSFAFWMLPASNPPDVTPILAAIFPFYPTTPSWWHWLRGVQSPTSSLLLPLPSLSLERHFVKVIKQGFIQQTGGSNIFVVLQGNQNLRQSQCWAFWENET